MGGGTKKEERRSATARRFERRTYASTCGIRRVECRSTQTDRSVGFVRDRMCVDLSLPGLLPYLYPTRTHRRRFVLAFLPLNCAVSNAPARPDDFLISPSDVDEVNTSDFA